MDKLIELKGKRVFTLEEARALVPIVHRITKNYCNQVQALISRLEALGDQSDETVMSLEAEINRHVDAWQTKMEKLGAQTKGLWIADFDSGDGYYCWKFPETEIKYWHEYSDGYSGRIPVSEIQPHIAADIQLPEIEA